MKKTYRNTLPKDMEVSSTDVRIENGEVIVDVELKEKFEPKDGDFLVSGSDLVFIYNGNINEVNKTYGAYVGMTCERIKEAETEDNWTLIRFCRFATPEEKDVFLARLEKECGKRWNEKTKKLEEIKIKKSKKELFNEFEELAQPLIDFINENYHPHCSIIIDCDHAELLEGLVGFGNNRETEKLNNYGLGSSR